MLPHPARWLPVLLEPDERYRLAAWLFLRLLALIYLAAFISAALEIRGLVGQQGILPAGEYLAMMQHRYGDSAWLRFPTLFWLNSSDFLLQWATYAGCAMAVLLLIGWRQRLMLVGLFVLYLSLFKVGQTFFNFQWDYLLLEAGFLAIFLVGGPRRLLVFLFHWLLFRLRFLSGLSKLLSGDPSWANLTALNHYFQTQPLPHLGSWYAQQLPEWLLRVGTGTTLFLELVVPFFIFLPRPFRLFAALATLTLQVLIVMTSNHNFFNLLTIALCLFVLDDRALRRVIPAWIGPDAVPRAGALSAGLLLAVAAVLLPASTYTAWQMITDQPARAGNHPVNWVRAWGLANVYHVFPTMQTERQELLIQGSDDGRTWQSYRFRYKPNSADDQPAFVVPLHPRLDWMMWFIPPQNPAMRAWFERFLMRLHQGSPSVTALLAHDPFAGHPPRHLRVLAYRYRFTTPQERRTSGRVWHVELLGEFPRVAPRAP